MTTPENLTLAAHLSADLACQFARRHEGRADWALAAQNYREAAALYVECGCSLLADLAYGSAIDCAARTLAAGAVPAIWPAPFTAGRG